ncbi:unnamed protein product [Lactuca virosa]|uniref:Uncharacterized protein n=1 Tax=Lactuca virosa TaxID=75947 RepID=A0AAU9NJ75_9ASTR|nr:unnamed protein product [Lactuca virosa]
MLALNLFTPRSQRLLQFAPFSLSLIPFLQHHLESEEINGRLGTNTCGCSTLHIVATRTPFSVTRKRQAAGVREHEDQRQGYRRSHSHLLRHLHHSCPRPPYPYLHWLISDLSGSLGPS